MLGLAGATAVVVIVALSIFHAPNAPVIQLAMLDTVGGTRGTDTNELTTLQGTWKESPVQHFSNASELEAWEKNWPNGGERPAAKIIYDPAAGEVRVSGRSRGKFFQTIQIVRPLESIAETQPQLQKERENFQPCRFCFGIFRRATRSRTARRNFSRSAGLSM